MKKSFLTFILITAVCLVLLPGCYVVKQGIFLFHYTSEAEDIRAILRQDDLPDETRQLLEKVVEIKQFAVDKLGLKDNKNYSRYVEIEKGYLVDVVAACKDDMFEPYTWEFPIVGEVPYKGFYQNRDAEKLSEKLKLQNYDVIIRQVDAFSTLGFFKDPIYSFMASYSDYFLANLIIHEQTHATIFVKSEIQFNEELATFTGNEGALLYLAERDGGSQETRELIANYHIDQEKFYSLMHSLHYDLDALYNQTISREKKLEDKEAIIEAFQEDIRDNYDTYFLTDYFSAIPDRDINNAYILSWIRYTQDLSLFAQLYEKCDKSFPEMISRLKAVEEWEGDPKELVRSLL